MTPVLLRYDTNRSDFSPQMASPGYLVSDSGSSQDVLTGPTSVHRWYLVSDSGTSQVRY